MKALLLVIAALILSGGMIWAQEEPDTTRIRIGKKKIIIIDDDITEITMDSVDYDYEYDPNENDDEDHCSTPHFESYWSGVDIGMNNVLNKYNKLGMPSDAKDMDIHMGKSWGVSLNPYEKGFNIYKEKIGITTGIGFEFNNYKFTKDITLVPDQDSLVWGVDSIKYDKTKLSTVYLNVPLLLEAREGKFHIAVGVIGGVKIGEYTKQVFVADGQTIKNKGKGNYHVNPFHYGATLRIGYGDMAIFANYNFSTLFEDNKGPEVYPFTIGFRVAI